MTGRSVAEMGLIGRLARVVRRNERRFVAPIGSVERRDEQALFPLKRAKALDCCAASPQRPDKKQPHHWLVSPRSRDVNVVRARPLAVMCPVEADGDACARPPPDLAPERGLVRQL